MYVALVQDKPEPALRVSPMQKVARDSQLTSSVRVGGHVDWSSELYSKYLPRQCRSKYTFAPRILNSSAFLIMVSRRWRKDSLSNFSVLAGAMVVEYPCVYWREMLSKYYDRWGFGVFVKIDPKMCRDLKDSHNGIHSNITSIFKPVGFRREVGCVKGSAQWYNSGLGWDH